MHRANNPLFGKLYTDEEKLLHSLCMKEYYKNHPEKKNNGKHWFTNGIINKFSETCSDGFHPGITRQVKLKGSDDNEQSANS